MARVRQGFALLALCFVASAGVRALHHAGGARAASTTITPQVRARGLTFAGDVAPSDRAWILAAVAKARPEAARLIGEVDGLVTFHVVDAPGARYVGQASPGTDDISLNLFYLDGERTADRDQTVLHELGHIVDFELVPDDERDRLAAELPSTGTCYEGQYGDCVAPEERFADTFAKWALRGGVSITGSGYSVGTPLSLEDWGAPLSALAVQLDVQARR